MKRAIPLTIVFVLIVWSVSACRPGWEQADEVRQQIDSLMSIRSKAENAIVSMTREIERLQEIRRNLEPRIDSMSGDVQALESLLTEIEEAMYLLANLIEAGESIDLSTGTTVDVDLLKTLANELLQEHEQRSESLENRSKALTILEKAASTADGKIFEARALIVKLTDQLAIIDAQIELLRVFQDNPTLLSEGGSMPDALATSRRVVEETQNWVEQEMELSDEALEFATRTANEAPTDADGDEIAPLPSDLLELLRNPDSHR